MDAGHVNVVEAHITGSRGSEARLAGQQANGSASSRSSGSSGARRPWRGRELTLPGVPLETGAALLPWRMKFRKCSSTGMRVEGWRRTGAGGEREGSAGADAVEVVEWSASAGRVRALIGWSFPLWALRPVAAVECVHCRVSQSISRPCHAVTTRGRSSSPSPSPPFPSSPPTPAPRPAPRPWTGSAACDARLARPGGSMAATNHTRHPAVDSIWARLTMAPAARRQPLPACLPTASSATARPPDGLPHLRARHLAPSTECARERIPPGPSIRGPRPAAAPAGPDCRSHRPRTQRSAGAASAAAAACRLFRNRLPTTTVRHSPEPKGSDWSLWSAPWLNKGRPQNRGRARSPAGPT